MGNPSGALEPRIQGDANDFAPFGCFGGLPRGRSVQSSHSFAAVRAVQASSPSGRDRSRLCSTRAASASGGGRFTIWSSDKGTVRIRGRGSDKGTRIISPLSFGNRLPSR